MADAQMDLDRIHERLDDLFAAFSAVKAGIERVEERCGPCNEKVKKHDSTLYGNGQTGLVTRITAAENGRVDTLSVKSIVSLLGAAGILVGAVAGGIGAVVATLVK